MKNLETLFIQNLPVGIIMGIGIVVLWIRLKDISADLKHLRDNCEKRLKWCVTHFQQKQE